MHFMHRCNCETWQTCPAREVQNIRTSSSISYTKNAGDHDTEMKWTGKLFETVTDLKFRLLYLFRLLSINIKYYVYLSVLLSESDKNISFILPFFIFSFWLQKHPGIVASAFYAPEAHPHRENIRYTCSACEIFSVGRHFTRRHQYSIQQRDDYFILSTNSITPPSIRSNN